MPVFLVEPDPIPLIGGGAALGLVLIVGRFLAGWLNTILRERQDLGGSYADILRRQTQELTDLKAENKAQLEEMRRELEAAKDAEKRCLEIQLELHGELRKVQHDYALLQQQVAELIRSNGGEA